MILAADGLTHSPLTLIPILAIVAFMVVNRRNRLPPDVDADPKIETAEQRRKNILGGIITAVLMAAGVAVAFYFS